MITFLLTEAAAAATEKAPESTDLLGQFYHANVFTLIIFVGLVIFFIKKFDVAGMLQQSRQKVAQELADLEKARQEAQRQLEDVRSRTNNLSAEIDAILAEAKTSAETMSVQIVDTARLDAAKLIENAKKRIEMEEKSAARQLETRLLNDALLDARLDLAQQTASSDQVRSVEAFIHELDQMKVS